MLLKENNYKRLVNITKSLHEKAPAVTTYVIDKFYKKSNYQSIYIKELNCIYIPIPKVGTQSLKKTFADYYYKVHSDQRFNTKKSKKWGLPFQKVPKDKIDSLADSVFVFSFVRNPYERVLSCYLDKIKNPTYYLGLLRYGNQFHKNMSFEEFLTEINKIPDNEADKHFRSQYFFLTNKEKFIPHFVGKLENISTDFQKVLDEIGNDHLEIFHANKSKSRKKREKYFTPKAKRLVWERYKEDFLHFEYPKR